MLKVLVASQPAPAGWLGGTTFSTVAHGALVALAVVSGGASFSSVREVRETEAVERVTYIGTPPLTRAAESAKQAESPEGAPARAKAPSFADASAIANLQEAAASAIEVPDLTAATDLTAVTDAWTAQPDGLAAATTTTAQLLNLRAGFTAPANGVYTADLVERSVVPKHGNPKPRYPSALADLGIEGAFMVKFVVDSTGDVPEDKIEFPSTMHRLFMSAVRVALLRSHFRPATVGGHVVPEEVMQEFRFEVGRRR